MEEKITMKNRPATKYEYYYNVNTMSKFEIILTKKSKSKFEIDYTQKYDMKI